MLQKLYYPILLLIMAGCITCGSKNIQSNNDESQEKRIFEKIKIKKGDTITGKVISIFDGDTYELLIKGDTTIRVRMEGIDAPEKGMPYNKKAKKYLSELCFNKNVKLLVTGEDKYNRVLGFTFAYDSIELSHEMIRAGLAWHFKKYNSDTDLSELEIKAKELRIGLWQDKHPYPPWEIRKLRKEGVSTKNLFDHKIE